MGIHTELEALGAALMVRRTKVLYGAIALLLFGALGSWVQVADSTKQADVATNNAVAIAPALTDACKNYKFYADHVEACGAAAQITADPTKPAAPSTVTVSTEMTALTNLVNR